MNAFLYVLIVVFVVAIYQIIRSRHLVNAIIAFIIDDPSPYILKC
jgi:multisubunit Na+/H+ antiporter MnhC subunit